MAAVPPCVWYVADDEGWVVDVVVVELGVVVVVELGGAVVVDDDGAVVVVVDDLVRVRSPVGGGGSVGAGVSPGAD